MSRPSTGIDYHSSESTVLYEDKDIKRVRRIDGTRAVGAKTWKGMDRIDDMSNDPYFINWAAYRLPDGSPYLMEEVIWK